MTLMNVRNINVKKIKCVDFKRKITAKTVVQKRSLSVTQHLIYFCKISPKIHQHVTDTDRE